MSDYERKLFINNIKYAAIGVNYLWGGQSPDIGFDCSGLVLWALKMIGWRLKDTTAQGLCDYFHNKKMMPGLSKEGCLWFYGESASKIDHVMIVLNKWEIDMYTLVGARGGNKTTTSKQLAFQKNAFVDVVLSNYWRDNFQIAVDPFSNDSGGVYG